MFHPSNPNSQHHNPSMGQPSSVRPHSNIGSGDNLDSPPGISDREIYVGTHRPERFPAPSPIRRYRRCNICSSTYRLGAEKRRWWKIHRTASSRDVCFIRYNDEIEPAFSCGSKMESILAFFVMTFLFIVFFLTVIWIVYYRNGLSLANNTNLRFNWHPLLMVVGFVMVSGFSMLLPRLCFCLRSSRINLVHTILHLSIIPCAVFGIIAVLDHHDMSKPPLPNFKSLHSWLGLLALGTYVLQLIIGLLSLFPYSTLESDIWCSIPSSITGFHKTLGAIHFALVAVTCVTGTSENMLRTDSTSLLTDEAIFRYCLGLIFLMTGILLVMFLKFAKS